MKIKTETLVRRVRKLAEEYPHASYVALPSGCYYKRGEVALGPPTEGCIMGHAMRGLIQLTADDEGRGVNAVLINHPDRVALNRDLLHWLRYVQSKQDQGYSWGEAVRLADQAAEWL